MVISVVRYLKFYSGENDTISVIVILDTTAKPEMSVGQSNFSVVQNSPVSGPQ